MRETSTYEHSAQKKKKTTHPVGVHGGKGGAETDGESAGGGGLDLDLDHLPRAQGNVREELGRGGAGKVDEATVPVG